jgi:hypothetical protein
MCSASRIKRKPANQAGAVGRCMVDAWRAAAAGRCKRQKNFAANKAGSQGPWEGAVTGFKTGRTFAYMINCSRKKISVEKNVSVIFS